MCSTKSKTCHSLNKMLLFVVVICVIITNANHSRWHWRSCLCMWEPGYLKETHLCNLMSKWPSHIMRPNICYEYCEKENLMIVSYSLTLISIHSWPVSVWGLYTGLNLTLAKAFNENGKSYKSFLFLISEKCHLSYM